MTGLFAVLLVAIGIFFIWRVVALMKKFRPKADPTTPVDGDTGVREPVDRHPPTLSGAVALDEPDIDESPTDAISRRS